MIATLLKSLAAVALLGYSMAAHASSSGMITVGKFSYTLVDLHPNDGIAPSLQFLQEYGGWSSASVAGYYDSAHGWDFIHDGSAGTNTLGVSHTDPVNGIEIKSYVGHRQQPDTHFLQLVARTPQDGTWGYLEGNASSGNLNFVLSPGTAVTFSVPIRTSVTITEAPGAEQLFATLTWVTLWLGDDPNFSHNQAFREPTDGTLELLHTVSPSYANTSDQAITGAISMQTFIWASSSGIVPVPEPNAAFTLLAGLCALGLRRQWACRRTRITTGR